MSLHNFYPGDVAFQVGAVQVVYPSLGVPEVTIHFKGHPPIATCPLVLLANAPIPTYAVEEPTLRIDDKTRAALKAVKDGDSILVPVSVALYLVRAFDKEEHHLRETMKVYSPFERRLSVDGGPSLIDAVTYYGTVGLYYS